MTTTARPTVRRTVRYASFDALLAEAERAVAAGATTCGNWTLGQILEHLARGLEGAVDGFPFRSPWVVRVVARWVVLPRILARGMPAGFKLKGEPGKALLPGEVSAADALAHLRRGVARFTQVEIFQAHPIFGSMSTEQSRALQLRHAELHMSFVVIDPGADGSRFAR